MKLFKFLIFTLPLVALIVVSFQNCGGQFGSQILLSEPSNKQQSLGSTDVDGNTIDASSNASNDANPKESEYPAISELDVRMLDPRSSDEINDSLRFLQLNINLEQKTLTVTSAASEDSIDLEDSAIASLRNRLSDIKSRVLDSEKCNLLATSSRTKRPVKFRLAAQKEWITADVYDANCQSKAAFSKEGREAFFNLLNKLLSYRLECPYTQPMIPKCMAGVGVVEVREGHCLIGYECEKPGKIGQCPMFPEIVPECEGGTIHPRFDSKTKCQTGYYCEMKVIDECPYVSAGMAVCQNGTPVPVTDDDGCVVKYDCQRNDL